MKKRNNNLDEMQELKLLHIEHTAFWICFWGLLAVIYIQTALGHDDIGSIIGECVILLAVSAYFLISCIKNGIWDRRLKPNAKTNAAISILAGLVVGGFWFAVTYFRYHALLGSVAAFIFMAALTGVLVLSLLTVFSALYKKKRHQLDDQEDETDE